MKIITQKYEIDNTVHQHISGKIKKNNYYESKVSQKQKNNP